MSRKPKTKTLKEMVREEAEEALRQYLEDDDDDDPDSPGNQLGAQIFEYVTGSSVEDIMNAEDYPDDDLPWKPEVLKKIMGFSPEEAIAESEEDDDSSEPETNE